MLYHQLNRPSFYLQEVSRLFGLDRHVCKEDFLRRLSMDEQVEENVKQLFTQLPYDEVYVDAQGRLILDSSIQSTYSDG